MSDRARRRVGLALAAYAVLVAVVLLSPGALVASTTVGGTEQALVALGCPAWLTERTEVVLNAGMFVPLTLLASLLWPARGWETWTAWAFVGSGTVEVLQALVVTPRSAQYVDVVANTTGGLVGALVAVVVGARLSAGSPGPASPDRR